MWNNDYISIFLENYKTDIEILLIIQLGYGDECFWKCLKIIFEK